jgi:hypothetical protein
MDQIPQEDLQTHLCYTEDNLNKVDAECYFL